MFENFGENLTKKLGPFPVWVWGVLIGGVVIAWYWYSGFGIAGPPDGGGDPEFTNDQLPPSGDFSERVVVPESDSGVDQATNQEWLSQALNAASSGGGSLLEIRTALQKFLSGEPLSPSEQAHVDRALAAVGQPPEGTAGLSDLEESTERGEWNPATTTVIKSPNGVRAGTPLLLRVHVRWADAQGRAVNPGGVVHIAFQGKHWRTVNLTNGSAVVPFFVQRRRKREKLVFTARYPGNNSGSSSRRATGSAASPTATTVQ